MELAAGAVSRGEEPEETFSESVVRRHCDCYWRAAMERVRALMGSLKKRRLRLKGWGEAIGTVGKGRERVRGG